MKSMKAFYSPISQESSKGHPPQMWLHNEQSKSMLPKCWVNNILLYRLTLFDCTNLYKFNLPGAKSLEGRSRNFISCNDLFRPLECHLFPSRNAVQSISVFHYLLIFPSSPLKVKVKKKKSPTGLQTSLMVWAVLMNISEETIFAHSPIILKGTLLYQKKNSLYLCCLKLPEICDLVKHSNTTLVINDAYGNCDSQAA